MAETIVKLLWMIFIVYTRQKSHEDKLEDLLMALIMNRLNISPKMCQLLKNNLQYMHNTIFIKVEKVCVKPMRMRIETIQRLKHTNTPKRMQKFCCSS